MQKIRKLFQSPNFDEGSSYLLSQELAFEYSKSLLTFSMAFIGGVVTLKSALAINTPLEDGFSLAIGFAGLAAILSFETQQSIIRDLRLKKTPSPIRILYRSYTSPFCLGVAIGYALNYFGVLIK